MFLSLNNSMILVFDLKQNNLKNKEHVKNVQLLMLNNNKLFGLQGKYGLYDSSEWWKNIKEGLLPNKVISGEIIRLYKSGQDNNGRFNSFELMLGVGSKWTSGIYVNDESDFKLFKIGKKVSIFYILEELKNGDVIDLVVEMAVSI